MSSVQDQIEGGCKGTVKETPKEDSPVFKKCVYTLVGNNDQSLDVSAEKAKELGYNPVVMYSGLEGEATEMAEKLIQMARDIRDGKGKVKAPAAIIAGKVCICDVMCRWWNYRQFGNQLRSRRS